MLSMVHGGVHVAHGHVRWPVSAWLRSAGAIGRRCNGSRRPACIARAPSFLSGRGGGTADAGGREVAARAAAMREATRLKNRQLLSVADSIHTSQRTGTDRRYAYGAATSIRILPVA